MQNRQVLAKKLLAKRYPLLGNSFDFTPNFAPTHEVIIEKQFRGEPGYSPRPGIDFALPKDGRDGVDGLSAYEIALQNGFSGTEQQWLDSLRGEVGIDGHDGKDGSPDTAKQIIDKLNTLIGKLNYSVIKGAPTIDEILKLIKQSPEFKNKADVSVPLYNKYDQRWHGGGGSGSGSTSVRDDLSSQCNGVNMVFNLGQNAAVDSIMLYSTQFPIIYRPDVDFTQTAANQITLVGAQVGAPQTGQTLVATYNQV